MGIFNSPVNLVNSCHYILLIKLNELNDVEDQNCHYMFWERRASLMIKSSGEVLKNGTGEWKNFEKTGKYDECKMQNISYL